MTRKIEINSYNSEVKDVKKTIINKVHNVFLI